MPRTHRILRCRRPRRRRWAACASRRPARAGRTRRRCRWLADRRVRPGGVARCRHGVRGRRHPGRRLRGGSRHPRGPDRARRPPAWRTPRRARAVAPLGRSPSWPETVARRLGTGWRSPGRADGGVGTSPGSDAGHRASTRTPGRTLGASSPSSDGRRRSVSYQYRTVQVGQLLVTRPGGVLVPAAAAGHPGRPGHQPLGALVVEAVGLRGHGHPAGRSGDAEAAVWTARAWSTRLSWRSTMKRIELCPRLVLGP